MSRKFPSWCYWEGNPAAFQPAVQPPTNPGCTTSCKKLDGVAAWLLNGVAAVFFKTLERCSCINIDTVDEPDHDQNSSYQPLVSSNDVHFQQLGLTAERCGNSSEKLNKKGMEINNNVN